MPCDPVIIPLKIRRGTKFGPVTLQCLDTNSAPIDLTGFGVRSLARPELESPNTVDLTPVISDAVNGKVQYAQFTEDTSNAAQAGDYGYDVVLVDLDGQTLPPLAAGPLRVIDFYSRE